MEEGKHINLELRNRSEFLMRCFISAYYQEEKETLEKLYCSNSNLTVFGITLVKIYGLKKAPY